ncbi:MAG: hypothetical protein LBV77_05090 [Candidatus Adiutrix intracellularis]|nr:hypothetical protein [Candidatus Adiutrix intracellularis]
MYRRISLVNWSRFTSANHRDSDRDYCFNKTIVQTDEVVLHKLDRSCYRAIRGKISL